MNSTAPQPDVRFGFIGAGTIARAAVGPAVHAADGAVLQAVAARDSARARALEPKGRVHAGAPVAEDAYAALLSDAAVDVVYINLSNEAHIPWVTRALAAGKHVLCEQPLGLTLEETTAAFAAADAAGRLLVEATSFRWHPRVRWAEQLVAVGDIGDVVRVDGGYCYDDVDWSGEAAGSFRLEAARGGGALHDVGVYPLSLARCALPGFGTGRVDIDSVEVTWSSDLTPAGGAPVDLSTRARLRSGDATVDVRCAISGSSEESATVTGTAAALRLEGPAFTSRDARSGVLVFDPSGTLPPAVEEFAPADPYRLMIEAMAAAVRGEDAFVVSREDSLAIAKVSEAIRTVGARPDNGVAAVASLTAAGR